MQIVNADTGNVLFTKGEHANTFLKRLKGLLFQRGINENAALFFSKTNSIHTLFMQFAIDVIYLDNDFRIVEVIHNLKPNKISFNFKASHIIEVQAGMCSRLEIVEQQQLKL